MEENLALEEQIGAIGDAERLFHVVVGDEHADVLLLELPHDILDVLHGDGVHTGERLVEHDEEGIDGQTAGYLRATAFAAGELVTQILTHLLQTEFVNEALQLFALILTGLARHLQHGGDVVLHRHLAKHRGLLRQIADALSGPLVDGVLGDFLAAQEDVAAVGHHEARGHVERGRLAGAVGPQQTHNLPLVNIERNVVHHGTLAIDLHESLAAQFCSFLLFHA